MEYHHTDRALVYRSLGSLFRPPEDGKLKALRGEQASELADSLHALGADSGLVGLAKQVADSLAKMDEARLAEEWEANFGVSGGLRCPLGETAHTAESPQEAWLSGYRLADIAGFYKAFGVEVAPETDRPDQLAVELEFMHLLAVKEAVAEAQGEREDAALCREAAQKFLRDHLGRWTGEVRARLADGQGAFYVLAATLLERFVDFDAGLLENTTTASSP
jgi:TorA maturation chaperone TorD